MEHDLAELNRDSFVDIYRFLWRRTPEGSRFAAVSIPDTMVVVGDSVRGWYFTSKQGDVLRRHRENTSEKAILEALRRKGRAKSPCEALAVRLSSVSDDAGAVSSHFEHLDDSALGSLPLRPTQTAAAARGSVRRSRSARSSSPGHQSGFSPATKRNAHSSRPLSRRGAATMVRHPHHRPRCAFRGRVAPCG